MANNAALRTKQKWDANKENNKIRIHKHIKRHPEMFPLRSPAHAPAAAHYIK